MKFLFCGDHYYDNNFKISVWIEEMKTKRERCVCVCVCVCFLCPQYSPCVLVNSSFFCTRIGFLSFSYFLLHLFFSRPLWVNQAASRHWGWSSWATSGTWQSPPSAKRCALICEEHVPHLIVAPPILAWSAHRWPCYRLEHRHYVDPSGCAEKSTPNRPGIVPFLPCTPWLTPPPPLSLGLAYGVVGRVPAVYGLYTSVTPSLIYILLGNRPEMSIGCDLNEVTALE